MLAAVNSSEPARFLEARVSELEHFIKELSVQMCHMQKELSEKVSIYQLDSTVGKINSQLDQRAMVSHQMDDKLLSLRFEQLDAKFNMLERDMPHKNEITRIEQDLQSVQQVLNLENLNSVRESVSTLQMQHKASINELDNVKRTVHQELGKNTADVICCLEDGLQGLRREIIHHSHDCVLSPRHTMHLPLHSVADTHQSCCSELHAHHSHVSIGAAAVEQNALEISACELDPHHKCSASFMQVDLNLRMLQKELTQKSMRGL